MDGSMDCHTEQTEVAVVVRCNMKRALTSSFFYCKMFILITEHKGSQKMFAYILNEYSPIYNYPIF